MSGFVTLHEYSPVGNLLVGIFGFLGLLGNGLFLVRRSSLPSPWNAVVGLVLSILCLSLGCQISGFVGMATRDGLSVWLLLWCGSGLCFLLWHLAVLPEVLRGLRRAQLLFVLPAVLLVLTAASISTKIDELYYHMLVPARPSAGVQQPCGCWCSWP